MGCGLKFVSTLLLAGLCPVGATTWCVTIAGLGGEPDYEQRFTAQAGEAQKILKAAGPDVEVTTLFGEGATKTALQSTLRDVASKAKPADEFVLMLIGHGTFDGTDYKFNLPGPDISGTEIAAMLDRIPASALSHRTTSALEVTLCCGFFGRSPPALTPIDCRKK